jgi:DNA-binding response OmpR family regulator
MLHSAGYGAELAGNQKRALELAARKDVQAAIVVQSRDLADLGQQLRDKIPRTILVGHRADEIVRPGHALQRADVSLEDALDEQKLLDWLGRPALPQSEGAPVNIGNCKCDLAGHTFVNGSGREVRLTYAETALLTAFINSPCRVLSRDQLRYAVAGRSAEPYDRSVDMLVTRLRRKIEPDPKAPRFILSIPGVGYKFDVRPQSATNGEALPALEPREAISANTPDQGRQRQRVMVITEFDAGDPEATMHALADEILKYRRAVRLPAKAIGWADAGAPFAIIPSGPLWRPRRTVDGADDAPPAA